MDKQLHIVTHDVPWPADFGGVVDLFYKIKSLHAKGIKIHLHCFMQNRPEQNMLNRLCVSVTYYPRKKNWQSLSFRLPYIVKSRSSIALYENLSRDNHPILFEGIHCTYLLSQKKLINRKIMVRLHNVEYEYYGQLARNETHIFKKIYFYLESKLLRHYERALAPNFPFIAVSTADALIYKYKLNAKQVEFLPVFIPWNKITSEIGLGSFCLYQGNLEISENQQAAEWLLNHVFKNVKIPFVIAGKNPPLSLQKKST